jgi:hypothetical protein
VKARILDTGLQHFKPAHNNTILQLDLFYRKERGKTLLPKNVAQMGCH